MRKGLIIFITISMLLVLSSAVFADPSPGDIGAGMQTSTATK